MLGLISPAPAKPRKSQAATIEIPPLPVRKSKRRFLPTDTEKAVPDAKPEPIVDPNVWTPKEIETAQKACKQILASLEAVTFPAGPVKKGQCGDPAPVRLMSVGRNPPVSFSPPAVVNCNMVKALHKWTTQKLQPLAKRFLKSPIIKVEVMAGYSCRNRYGRKTGRLSEHALANALDIGGFVTQDGQRTRLLADWGMTVRDIVKKKADERAAREAALKSAQAAQEEKDRKQAAALKKDSEKRKEKRASKTATKKTKNKTKKTTKVASLGRIELKQKKKKSGTKKVGTKKPKKKKRRRMDKAVFSPATSKKAQFLRQAHNGACRVFGTTLGPEANDAHRNHFHIDLAPRRRRNYCQ